MHDAHQIVPWRRLYKYIDLVPNHVNILLDLKLVFLAGLHILKKHLHIVVSVWSGLFVHWIKSMFSYFSTPHPPFAKGVEKLMKDCILGEAAGDLQVDHLLPALLAHVGPAARGHVAVPEVSVDGEPQKERLW